MKEIEIVLVDDASPDRCGLICDEYAAKDSRIKVIHHLKNIGLSAARNTGIANATSDYLMFVDSDDYVHENFCKLPYECAIRQKADLVMFRFKRENINSNSVSNTVIPHNFEVADLLKRGYKTQREALELLLCNEISVGQTAWSKLYRKVLFEDISYPIGYLYEDVGTTYKIVLKASVIYFLDEILYYRCYRKGSITTLKTEKSLKDNIVMFLQQYRDLIARGYHLKKLDIMLINNALTYCICQKKDCTDSEYFFCSNVLLSCKKVPQFLTWKRKIMFVLFKYCPVFFELVCKLCGRKKLKTY